jgi:aminoglycoside phosphotransferase (APT) family kinase protein
LQSVDGPCLIHRDFRPGNLIVYDGKLQGIIDWSSGRGGFAEEDFCPIEHGEWQFNAGTKKDFLVGYSSVRSIPNYTAIMPLLRMNRAFATMGFMIKNRTWESTHARVYQFNLRFLETVPHLLCE